MPDPTPEQRAREQIDAQLVACGWVVQDYRAVDFSAGRVIALREVPLTTGPCDYLLLVDRKALGVIEAKKEGTTLSTVADQSARYANSLPDFLAAVAWTGIADAREHDGRTIYETFQHTNLEGIANSASRLLPSGTVCISRTASVGYVVVMGREMATSQDFVNWIPTQAVTSDWLRIIFSADREALRRFGKGSVHKTIYFPEWLSVHIAVPPLAEQMRIVAEVARRLSVVEELEEVVSANLQRATRLHQSILQRAFTGELL